jgi:hypothetical protein
MSDEELLHPLLDAPEAELVAQVEVQACFSRESFELRLSWSRTEASLSRDNEPPVILDLGAALQLARRLIEAAERPEIPTGAGSTTHYCATLRWAYPGADSRVEGSTHFRSNDLSLEELKDLLRARPELLAKVPPGAYSRARGLFELVREVRRGKSSPSVW